MNDIEKLMVEHEISVWLDPDFWPESGVPRWLAGQNIRAEEGRHWSTLTGTDPSSVVGDNTAHGHTPGEAVLAVVAILQGQRP